MRRLATPGLLSATALLATGCVLVFDPPTGQHLEAAFELSRTLARGERHLVAVWTLAEGVDTRRRFLQLSGSLARPEGGRLPREIDLVATVTEPPAERVRQRLRLSAAVTPEDRFRVSKKVRRDLSAGSRVEVTIEPVGDDLAAGTGVALCVDLVAKRRDLASFPSCAAGGGPTTFAAVQQRILTPKCALSGCHDPASAQAGLVLAAGSAYAALVGVPSSQAVLRLRVDPGRPDDSYLVQKLRGSSAISGGRMPLGGPFLSADEISGVVEWIGNGAGDD